MKLVIVLCASMLLYLSAFSSPVNATPAPYLPTCDTEHPGLCTKDYNPVCGTDGKTFANECSFCLEHGASGPVLIAHAGEC